MLENCGERDHYSRDCPNDKQDNSWTDGGAWGTQARATGTVGEAVGAKAKTDTGMESAKNGKDRTDRMIGPHEHGKARAARKAAAALTNLVTLTCGRSQTDHGTDHNQKKKSTSAR